MKFLLLRTGNFESDKKTLMADPSILPPLGLLYIGSILEQDGHDVEILDHYMEKLSKEKLKKALMSSDAIGMTVYSDSNLKPYLDISKMIKHMDSDIPQIIGGPHCSFVQKQSLQDIPLADISVIGEGENVIIDLVRHFQGKKNLKDIPGIYYRNNGSIMSGKPLKIIEDLDSIPFPARHLVDKYDYGDVPFGYQLKKMVSSMVTSRGCPFHCRFCARYSNIIKRWRFRQRSTENILQEFEEIDEKYRTINIVDDSFLAVNKRAHRIFDGLINMGKDFDLVIQGTRVDFADKILYKKMKKAGVKIIFLGIESGNQDVLDFYNKEITLSQIRNAVKLSRKMNFITMGSFIIGAPMETKKHIENTIKFACSLPLDFASFGILKYIKGSQLYNETIKNNKILNNTDKFFYFADSDLGLGSYPLNELMDYILEAFRRFYFRPTYMISQIYRNLLRNNFTLIQSGINLLFSMKKEMWNYQKTNPNIKQ